MVSTMRPHGLRGTDCGQHSAKALRRPGVGFSNSHLRLALETKLSVRNPNPVQSYPVGIIIIIRKITIIIIIIIIRIIIIIIIIIAIL